MALFVLMAAAALRARPASGQAAWYEGFEGPEPSWRDVGGNARYRTERHERVQGEARTGEGCERLTLVGDHGTYVHLGHEVGRPRVIDELLPSVWIKSDRSGLQILARVVLPRTADPRTGRPVSTLVRGLSYTDVGRWQQLRIEDVPRLLARQIRILRTQLGPNVDGREAYVDGILLNVYGGPGTTNVWIDDLEVAGHVGAPPDAPLSDGLRESVPAGPAGDPVAGGAKSRRVELAGSVLLVGGRPVFPRIIWHQGEPLVFLKQLGFNGVWLDRPASPEVLQQAAQLEMWLVCPPPRPIAARHGGPVAAPPELGPEYAPVLAWDLGWRLSPGQVDATSRFAGRIRLADRHYARPLICQADSDLRAFSRQVDLLMIDRRPLGSSLELTDYGTWVRRGPRLARPGTPIWTTVQTQPAPALRGQLVALEPDSSPPLSVAGEQVRLVALMAVASGSRGLLFISETPLDATDADTRYRAAALELLNLELQLIEPWAATGNLVASARATEAEVLGTVLSSNRSRLLLPVWITPGAQYAAGQSAADSLSLVVPGVPDSSGAYELRPGGLQPLKHRRVTGGMRVTLPEFGLSGQVLLSPDPLVVNMLSQRSAAIGPRAAELGRHLAAHKLNAAVELADRLPHRGTAADQSAAWISTARKSFQWSDGYFAARDYRAAYLHARRAMRALRLLERAHWQGAVAGLTSPLSSPGSVSFATLPWHWHLVDRIACWRLGPNRLGGGDFEDLRTLLAAGWNHFRHNTPGLHTAADLVAEAAHSGTRGLRLSVRAEEPENPPALVETPPIWITSPAVPVQSGGVVCIQGWVHIPAPITGSVDGLLVIDSLAGEPLAERLGRTSGWQQFTLYRAVPRSGQVTVTFALSGLGEVRLDDVTIQVLEPAGPGGMTQRSSLGHLPR